MREGKIINKDRITWKDFLPILLAIPAAIAVKMLLVTSYHVPTASMSSTIIPGDHIMVEKYILGTRIFFNGKIYRLPGFRSVRRGDVLVFNVPKEDSTLLDYRNINYYTWKHSKAESEITRKAKDSLRFTPVPFRTPFVKRAIGLPGDTVFRQNSMVWVNETPVEPYAEIQQEVRILFNDLTLFDQWKNKLYQRGKRVQMSRANRSIVGIFRAADLEELSAIGVELHPMTHFPSPQQIPGEFSWAKFLATGNNMQIIPSKGWTSPITPDFIRKYGHLIRRFEEFKGKIEPTSMQDVEGQEMTHYTFRQNYYWCLGDNRPYSIDSRTWGLVPEDHIIGISRRTFWSKEPVESFRKGFRWNRFYHRLK